MILDWSSSSIINIVQLFPISLVSLLISKEHLLHILKAIELVLINFGISRSSLRDSSFLVLSGVDVVL